MATYDAPLHLEAFENMESNNKTVYTLPATLDYRFMVAGDRLEFGSFGSITIGMVRKYESLEELVKAQGWQCLVPEAEDAVGAIDLVRSNESWDRSAEDEHGVLALRVREARRK